jgi:hypothetical protein
VFGEDHELLASVLAQALGLHDVEQFDKLALRLRFLKLLCKRQQRL